MINYPSPRNPIMCMIKIFHSCIDFHFAAEKKKVSPVVSKISSISTPKQVHSQPKTQSFPSQHSITKESSNISPDVGFQLSKSTSKSELASILKSNKPISKGKYIITLP